jgi:CRP/FNR family cyclic AMP-dependent transcriptional regulator
MPIPGVDLGLLAKAGFPLAAYGPGEVIFAEGDKGEHMYVVRSGNVEIERNGEVIETLSGGGIFGEMALIDGSPRSATARAKTACELAPISEKSFLFLVHETQFFAIAVMRTLAERLRRSRAPTVICRGVGHPPLPIFALHCRSRRP